MNKFDMAATSDMNTSTETMATTTVDGRGAAQLNLQAFQVRLLLAKAPPPPEGDDDNV